MLKRSISNVLNIIGIFIVLSLCGFSFTSTPEKLRIGFHSELGYQPIALAKEKKFFEREGMEVDLQQFDSINDVTTAFATGKIDAMISPVNDVITLAEKGTKLKMVLITDYASNHDANVMSIRQDYIDKNPNNCIKLINTYFRTVAWTQDNKPEAVAILSKLTNSTADTLKNSLESHRISSLKDNLIAFGNPAKKGTLYAGTEKKIKSLLNKKTITGSIETESLINPELIWTVTWSDLRAYNNKDKKMDKDSNYTI